MKRIGKKIVALLIVFASIVSFLPIDYLGNIKNVYAASNDDIIEAATIKVSEANNPNTITPYKDTVDNNIDVYSTDFAPQNGFDIFLNNVSVTKSDLAEEARKLAAQGKGENGYSQETYESQKRIVSQEIKIKYIDGLVADPAELSSGKASIEQIGVEIQDCGSVKGQKRLGKSIVNLPLGVNRIKYEVTVKKQKAIYNPEGNPKVTYSVEEGETYSEEIIINNGKRFVINQIQQLRFYQFIGANNVADLETDKENNSSPFLYEANAKADKEIPLRYTWEVPDSLQTLTYTMTFGLKIDDSSTVHVYKNGTEQVGAQIKNNSINGNLNKISTSELIVVDINGTGINEEGKAGPISKLYSIELRYPPKSPAEDFSIQKAGITKYQYNDNDNVKAYIGKRFEIEEKKNEDGTILEYNGEIYIDSKAGLISFDPTLVAQSGDGTDLTYELSLEYVLNGEFATDPNIELINNKQFIPFNKGQQNTIVLAVYNKGKLVCRYKLKVCAPDTPSDDFDMDLRFDGNDLNDNTFLTAEGASEKFDPNNPSEAKSKSIKFSKDRLNYDLYTKREGTVDIGLVNITGENEYLRVYLSNSVNGSNAKEAEESKENTFDESSGARNSELSINFGTAKSIVVQAYYDKVEEYTEGGVTKYKLDKSEPIGRKYVFNIRANIKNNQGGNGVIKSDDARLSMIKVKGETLEGLSGEKGFNSEVSDYEVKVDKDKTSSLITVVPEDENVKSMIATIQETGEEYEFYSDEELEIALSKSGTTTINIEVTAQDGKTTKNYSVRITNNTKGGNSKLKNVVLNTGDYNFNPSEYTTKVYVDQTTNKILVSPTAEDPEAKITVDGQRYNSTAISVSLVGTQKKEIEIVVTSEDGKNKTTYTLVVKRVTSTPDDNNNDYGNKEDSYFDHDNNIWIDNSKYNEWGTTSDGRVVYYDTKGRQVKDRWILTNNKYYYVNKSGYRATGWKIDSDGKTYYLDPTSGEMKTGWIYVNGSTYYLNPRGIMQRGWLNIGNQWYYFTSNGQMLANTSMYIDGQLYKFNQNGTMYY